MSLLSFQVDVKDDVSQVLAALENGLASKTDAGWAAAESIQNLVAEHFVERGSRLHHSYAEHNFYEDAAQATMASNALEAVADGINLIIYKNDKQGVAQRYYGGTITPKHANNLAIPAPLNPESYGKMASEIFDEWDLKWRPYHGPHSIGALVTTKGGSATMIAPRTTGKKKGQFKATGAILGETVMYWLCKSVEQEADPTVLPTDEEMHGAAREGTIKYVRSLLHDSTWSPAA